MINSMTGMMIGGGLLAAGVLVIFFSPYRRWLAFMLAGMTFWSFLEASRIGAQYLFNFNDFQGYMTGMGLALGILASWLAATERREEEATPALYIEHTPVYDDELNSASQQH